MIPSYKEELTRGIHTTFELALKSSLVPEKVVSGTPTFTRSSIKTVTDFEGIVRTCKAGEIGIVGARRVENLITASENLLNASWIPGPSASASDATHIAVNASTSYGIYFQFIPPITGATYLITFEIQGIKGNSINASLFDQPTGLIGGALHVEFTGDVQQCSFVAAVGYAFYSLCFGPQTYLNQVVGTTNQTFFLSKIFLLDVTGQSVKTVSNYVSTGILSSPYHGANVDRVAYLSNSYPIDKLHTVVLGDSTVATYAGGDYIASFLPQNNKYISLAFSNDTINQQKTRWNNLSALDKLYTHTCIVQIGLNDCAVYTDSIVTILGRYQSLIDTILADNATINIYLSTMTPAKSRYILLHGATNGAISQQLWVDVNQAVMGLGATPLTGNYGYISEHTALLDDGDGNLNPIYNDNSDLIHENNTARAIIAAQWESVAQFPAVPGLTAIPEATLRGYLAEGARTNYVLRSGTPSNATWIKRGTATSITGAADPFGGTNGETVTVGAVSTNDLYQVVSAFPVSTALAMGIWIKRVTTSGTLSMQTPVITGGATGNWSINLALLPDAYVYLTTSHPAVTVNTAYVSSSTGNNGVWFYCTAGCSFIFGGVQLEAGAFASSYIATTTAAITRAADVLSYPTAGNLNAAAGGVYLEFTPEHAPSGTIALLGSYVDASNYTAILHNATSYIFRKRIADIDYEATIARTFISGTKDRIAVTWGNSGINIAVNSVCGTVSNNSLPAPIGTTIQIGELDSLGQQPFGKIKNVVFYKKALKTAKLVRLTS